MDLHGPVPGKSRLPSSLLVSVLSACGVVALAASALVVVAVAAAAPLVVVEAAAAPSVAAAAAAAAAVPLVAAAALATAASSAAAAAHEGVQACPALGTVAAPLLQLMRRAPQGLEGTLLGGGCGRDKG